MGKKMTVASPQVEAEYLKRIKKYSGKVQIFHEDSVQEGFEFFESKEYVEQASKSGSLFFDKFLMMGLRNIPKMVKIMIKNMSNITKGRNDCYIDIKDYVDELEATGILKTREHELLKSYPNQALWDEMTKYAWDKWKMTIGFTELPNQLIFKGKAVLFKYALVCIQEMNKEKIDLAPALEAGEEVLNIYGSLGIAVNDIARWLRETHGIRCQSNHPLGGLVDTSPLAVKAGMGWQGHNGLLITPRYGQRQRIAPIFIEEKLFEYTDNHNHAWIEDFCKSCRKCQRSCPVQAIYPEKKVSIKNVPGIKQTRTCIDRTKCFPQFNKTLGCSICVKVCPFSQGDESYNKIKNSFVGKDQK